MAHKLSLWMVMLVLAVAAMAQTRPGDMPGVPVGGRQTPGTGRPDTPGYGGDIGPGQPTDQSQVPASSGKRVQVDDATLQRQVHEQLTRHPELANVDVAVSDAIVQLTGSVPRKQDRKRARKLARSVAGVRDVKDQLTLNAGAGAAASSTTGAENEGIVNTGGAAGTSATAGTNASAGSGSAEAPTRQNPSRPADRSPVGGTGSAQGATAPAASPESAVLGPQINNALNSDPALAKDNLRVEVTDTDIILTGSVGSGREKQTAQRIAESYAANRRVVDRITIVSRGNANSLEKQK